MAGEDRVLACRRFARMAESGEYDIRTRAADFVIGVIEKTFKHRQGQKLDGTPLGESRFCWSRGKSSAYTGC